MEILLIQNDNLLVVDKLTDTATDTYLNGKTLTVTVYNTNGNEVAGQSWPATMSYVTDSDGKYILTLEDDLVLKKNKTYKVEIDLDAGGDQVAHWEIPAIAKVRDS